MKKLYIKDNEIKPQSRIVIYKDDMQIFNPSEELLLECGWVEYVVPSPLEPTEEELFSDAKENLKQEILDYDSSQAVNEFYMEGQSMWLDKATRAGLLLRLQAEQAMGEENTTLWYGIQQYELPIDRALQLLYAIESYASKCYDVTHMHLANVEELQDIESVKSYNYMTNYPDKLHF